MSNHPVTLSARYVDTCLSSYLLDGHNRPGEALALASLGGGLDETIEELAGSLDFDAMPDVFSDAEIRDALRPALEGVDLRYIDPDGERCDERPEIDHADDEPFIYVVLEWDAEALTAELEALSRGFDRGNFAAAYEGEDLEDCLETLDDRDDEDTNPYGDAGWPNSLAAAYRAAFIIGFCATWELSEMPGSWREEFDAAYHSAWGRRVLALGYADSRDEDYRREADKIRCRYTDCKEQHPIADDDTERVTCPTCRDYLGLPTEAE